LRQTDIQTNEQMDSTEALSRCRCRQRRLNKRRRSRYCTVEGNYWQTQSIARPLSDSRAFCMWA